MNKYGDNFPNNIYLRSISNISKLSHWNYDIFLSCDWLTQGSKEIRLAEVTSKSAENSQSLSL